MYLGQWLWKGTHFLGAWVIVVVDPELNFIAVDLAHALLAAC